MSSAHAVPIPTRLDPLERVIGLDARMGRPALAVALAGALLLHGLGVAVVQARVTELGAFVVSMRAELRSQLLQSTAVTVEAPPPEPEPPPPPTPEAPPPPEPAPAAPTPAAQAPSTPAAPAAAAAQAAQVMTAAPDPADPVDFTGDTFTTGNADRYAGGTTSSSGTSRVAVKDPNARGDGAPGGTGTAPAAPPPPPPAKDLSRAPGLTGGGWDCGFPPQADEAQVNFAVVSIAVTVGPDGRARSVSVLRDPGYGFGARARQCAMAKRYSPGLDAAGTPTTRTTPPITVRFTR